MLEPIDETWRTELMSRESNGITVRFSGVEHRISPELLRDAA
jgi:hypothetical protein